MINHRCCPQACRPQTSWNMKVDDLDSYLPHHQPIRRMSMRWSCPLWIITIKLLQVSNLGHTGLRALAHCGPLCLSKKYSHSFLLHLKPSPRFNSVSGYRGQNWLSKEKVVGSSGLQPVRQKHSPRFLRPWGHKESGWLSDWTRAEAQGTTSAGP